MYMTGVPDRRPIHQYNGCIATSKSLIYRDVLAPIHHDTMPTPMVLADVAIHQTEPIQQMYCYIKYINTSATARPLANRLVLLSVVEWIRLQVFQASAACGPLENCGLKLLVWTSCSATTKWHGGELRPLLKQKERQHDGCSCCASCIDSDPKAEQSSPPTQFCFRRNIVRFVPTPTSTARATIFLSES